MASATKLGQLEAESIVQTADLMYNKKTSRRYLTSLLKYLQRELTKHGVYIQFSVQYISKK